MKQSNQKQSEFEELRQRLVEALIMEGVLRTPLVIESMRKVPRELFVPESMKALAYTDAPLPTEQGQTISAPQVL